MAALGRDPKDDPAGHVLAQEPWEVVRLPAIADQDELHRIETGFGRQSFGRRAGEALPPELEPPEMLEHIRRVPGFIPDRRITPEPFDPGVAGQYQQTPSPQGGGMVKAAWFRSYAALERLEKFDRVVQSWDIPNKASELNPHPNPPPHAGRKGRGCTSWGRKGKDLYLLHVLRKRMEHPALKRAMREQCEAFEASVVLIEDKTSCT